jgi:hypothetical protein
VFAKAHHYNFADDTRYMTGDELSAQLLPLKSNAPPVFLFFCVAVDLADIRSAQ